MNSQLSLYPELIFSMRSAEFYKIFKYWVTLTAGPYIERSWKVGPQDVLRFLPHQAAPVTEVTELAGVEHNSAGSSVLHTYTSDAKVKLYHWSFWRSAKLLQVFGSNSTFRSVHNKASKFSVLLRLFELCVYKPQRSLIHEDLLLLCSSFSKTDTEQVL